MALSLDSGVWISESGLWSLGLALHAVLGLALHGESGLWSLGLALHAVSGSGTLWTFGFGAWA
eukprot:4974079-Amphidinium_carterae.1